MPITPIPNSGSQNDKAVAAYLIASGCGTAASVTPAHCTQEKTLSNITVKTFQMTDTESASGNEVWMMQIQVKASATNVPNAANPEAGRVAFDTLCGTVWAAMQQSEDGQTFDATAAAITAAGRALKTTVGVTPKTWSHPDNNTDMADYTCKHIYRKSGARGEPDDGGSWVEIRTYEVHCVPANVD